VRRSRQQTQIYANPRPQMPWRSMTSGGVHSPGACRRLPGCSSACVTSTKSRPCASGTLWWRDGPSSLGSARRASVGPWPPPERPVRSASLLGDARRADHRKRKSFGSTPVAPVANLENHGPSARRSPSRNAGHKRNGLQAQILVGPTGGLQRPTGLVLWLCLRPHLSSPRRKSRRGLTRRPQNFEQTIGA
jgi:hypothetical protein